MKIYKNKQAVTFLSGSAGELGVNYNGGWTGATVVSE